MMRALNQPELQSLFKGAVNKRDEALLKLLYSTGLRIFEAQRLTLQDVRENGEIKEWFQVTGKRNRKRLVHINEPARKALSAYVDNRVDNLDALWITLQRPWRQLTKRYLQKVVHSASCRAGIGPIYPHVLRATFLTDLERNGASLNVIQRAAGHASITTTQRYLLLSDTEMQTAIKNLHTPV